jgi:hypothetical protein
MLFLERIEVETAHLACRYGNMVSFFNNNNEKLDATFF